jgi:hypothetical protein
MIIPPFGLPLRSTPPCRHAPRAFRRRGAKLAAVVLAFAAALGACESPTRLDPLVVVIDSPAAGTTAYTLPVEITGRVVGAAAPEVSFSVNGGPHGDAELLPGTSGGFRITLAALEAGPVTVSVRARDRGRTADAALAIEYSAVALALDAPEAGATVYGRVAAFAGTVSVPSLAVRYSVNDGPERAVQQMPWGAFRGEAHPLPNGTSRIDVRVYAGAEVVAAESFEVAAEVPDRRYSVVVVDVPGSVDVKGRHLGNDGRVAGLWWSTPEAAHPFTWRAGELVKLDSMRAVSGLNNVGQVLGVAHGATPHSLIWRDGVYTPLVDAVGARALNDHGQLVRASTAGYWHDGAWVEFARPPGEALEVSSINNHGQIVGGRWVAPTTILPVLWFSPEYELLHLPYRAANAFRISDGAHVLLQAWETPTSVPEFQAVRHVYLHAGASRDLNAAVGFRTAAGDVNASGVVAGTYSWLDQVRPFTWQDGRTTDVVLDSGEWEVKEVWSINDHGHLAAHGRHRATGRLATLLLVPLD